MWIDRGESQQSIYTIERIEMFKYVLYRILGNDLPPRHREDQTERNVEFILANEPPLIQCDKRFLLNRIVSPLKVARLRVMIEAVGYRCDEIPFVDSEYVALGKSKSAKIDYLTNVNAARNWCICEGLKDAEFVMPFDGGNMFRQDGWEQADVTMRVNSQDAYFVLGQSRPKTYAEMLEVDEPAVLYEEYQIGHDRVIGLRELTVVFGHKADKYYDKRLVYGMVDKVDLLWKIGVPGIWDRWEPQLRGCALGNASEFFGNVKMAGWVARLPSGNSEADADNSVRGLQRREGVDNLVADVDELILGG